MLKVVTNTLFITLMLFTNPASYSNEFGTSDQYKSALLEAHNAALKKLATHQEILELLKKSRHNLPSLASIILKDKLWNSSHKHQLQITNYRQHYVQDFKVLYCQ